MPTQPTSRAQQNIAKCPANCFGRLLATDELILITAGESGYRAVSNYQRLLAPGQTVDQLADELNAKDGVTKAHREAMEAGSMFGWEVGGADPDRYDPSTGLPLSRMKPAKK